jgi:hypothetical protein
MDGILAPHRCREVEAKEAESASPTASWNSFSGNSTKEFEKSGSESFGS